MTSVKDPKIHRSLTPDRARSEPFSFGEISFFLNLHLSSGDGLADLPATLPRVQTALDVLGTLLDNLGTLGEDELDVRGVGHVRVDLELLEEAW